VQTRQDIAFVQATHRSPSQDRHVFEAR
jgi:hypothetical protein